MIDLSYLTEEEQEMIRTVLKRDNELKKKEEQRIKKLQKTEGDKRKLKYLTGEWFYETKSNRHRDRIHGSDIIRASMRHSQPVTIRECANKHEEGNSIAKVLEWFGRVSKDSSKVKERPASPEDANKEVPESLDTQVTDTASPTQEEAKAKPSPKPRRGLLALFSRTEAKVESPKNVATQEDVVSNSENIISQESKLPQTPPNSEADDISDLQSSLKLNVVTEQETSPLLLKTEDSANLDKESDEITKQKEGLDQGERSPNRLDSLKSFWERGNKGPKILSIKKSTDSNHSEMPNMSEDENKAMDLKPPEVPISPSTVKTLSESSEAPDEMLYTYVDSLESDKIIRQGADSSFLPSHEEQSPTFEIDQIPQEPCKSQTTAEESQSSPVKQKEQKDEILPPVPSIRKFPTQENTEPVTFSNLKSLWEKEKSGPKILISTTECVQAVHDVQDISDVESLDNNSKSVNETHLNVAPPSPDPVQDPKRRKSSLTREAEKIMLSLKEKIEKSQRKQSPGRVRAKSPLRGMSHSPDHVSPFKPPKSVSGSVMSIYGTDFGNVEVKGTIQFAINYVQKLAEFHIFIVQCRDLAVAEPKRNRSDPYVKCYLLPDKEKLGKRKTSVKKKTLNPTYNEILRFKITLDNLKSHTLNLSVWHNDTFGKNSFLGEVDVDLSEWDFSNSHMMDYALKGRVNLKVRSKQKYIHVLLIAGKKTPQNGEVQIWVKECKNLPARRGTIDPFIKCAVLPDTARKGRQKTRVVKRTANPVFNHTMVYDGLRPEDLREACVELTVWDHDRLSNHFIGGLRLGLGTGKSYGSEVDWMDSNTAEAGLWKRMTESQNEWVEDVIPLRMLIMARTVSK
uniref:Synaptotagmin-like 2a n=1 Tax=Astyanax mexicanus TaxID=7994 RepID=A0A8B9JH40_ASTMX